MNHLNSSIKMFNLVAKEQEEKGMEKYGQPLKPLDDYCWLNMAAEELVDGFKYLHAEQVKRFYVCNEIKKRTDDKEIHSLLGLLEGK